MSKKLQTKINMNFLSSSIGKKLIMAVSGLFYCLFLVGHLSGNFLLYVSKDAFNSYSDFLNSTSLIYVAEAVLVAMLILHVWTAIKLTRENRKASSGNYRYKTSAGQRTFASSHMLHSGLVILIFIIVHIYSFKFGEWDNAPDSTMTLYDLVALRFSDEFYSLGYVIAMVLMSMHLYHAIRSACHTIGLNKNNLIVVRTSVLFSIAMCIGFSSFPIYFYILSLNL